MTGAEFAGLLKTRVKGGVRFRYFVADELVYACDDG